ncbi:MAG: DNA-binding response regulator [Chloroflexi bacterium]|nr:DNA-binding response regulator [Chloroflexota bacterium]MDL1945020.1 response regulator transcription factor [Chloroflexi bacterium CFX2]
MPDSVQRSYPHILIVEDDPAIGAFVQTALEREGFVTELVKRGDTALECVETFSPDLILLDLMLPGPDGLQVCQALRRRPQYIPIIMLTAKDDDVDKIVGLEIGADDYITKPFKIRELLARIRALLRLVQRSASPGLRVFRFDSLEVNIESRTVTRGGRRVNLTPKEFELLALLVSNPRRVFGRETLLEKVWGYNYAGETRTVDVHIQRLRQKIEPDPGEPRFLVTVRNIGYKFETQHEREIGARNE